MIKKLIVLGYWFILHIRMLEEEMEREKMPIVRSAYVLSICHPTWCTLGAPGITVNPLKRVTELWRKFTTGSSSGCLGS